MKLKEQLKKICLEGVGATVVVAVEATIVIDGVDRHRGAGAVAVAQSLTIHRIRRYISQDFRAAREKVTFGAFSKNMDA